MRQKIAILAIAALTIATGFAAKKPKPKPSATLEALKIPQMTDDQKALHALNRLTFGPRPGDFEQVKQMGVDNWIEQQLNPETIPENPVLLAKIAPLDTLQMSTREMLEKYPSPQMVKAIADGKASLPPATDPLTRAAMQVAVARYEQKQTADAAGKADPNAPPDPQMKRPASRLTAQMLDALPLDPDQKSDLLNGTQQTRLDLLASLSDAQLAAVLEVLPPQIRNRLANAGPAALRRRAEVLSTPTQIVIRDLSEGKLLRAIYSNRQLEEVLTDFWFNHFNVYLDKGADRYMVTAYERDAIRPHVLGKFKDLLLATAESPAMLFFLDNWESVSADAPAKQKRQGLNENYGRELMELHTLGVDGGYTQQDVTEVARCFTGWTIRQPQQGGDFFFNPRLHDRGEKHVLGVTIPAGGGRALGPGGMEDGLKVIDILAHRPATARFISKSLAIRFVSDNPPDSLIDKMAATFTATDGDLREVMRTMLYSDEFWASANFRAKLKSPLEMVVSAVRAVNGDVENAAPMMQLMSTLGEPLYRKLEPTGYTNRGADWMNSASLLARMNFANTLAQGKEPGVKVDLSQFSADAAQIERNILFTDASPASQAAIQAGISQAVQTGPMVAGLTLGSPDFQRR